MSFVDFNSLKAFPPKIFSLQVGLSRLTAKEHFLFDSSTCLSPFNQGFHSIRQVCWLHEGRPGYRSRDVQQHRWWHNNLHENRFRSPFRLLPHSPSPLRCCHLEHLVDEGEMKMECRMSFEQIENCVFASTFFHCEETKVCLWCTLNFVLLSAQCSEDYLRTRRRSFDRNLLFLGFLFDSFFNFCCCSGVITFSHH